jgi:hypothetical protein
MSGHRRQAEAVAEEGRGGRRWQNGGLSALPSSIAAGPVDEKKVLSGNSHNGRATSTSVVMLSWGGLWLRCRMRFCYYSVVQQYVTLVIPLV